MSTINNLAGHLGVVFLGVIYVKAITVTMRLLHGLTGDIMTDLGKIAFIGSVVAASVAPVFIFNSYVLKGSARHLGYWCATFAFIYFYIVRADGNVAAHLAGTFLFFYSAAAFFLFTCTPILIGVLMTKRITNHSTLDAPTRRAS